jgi:hypothetical protein
MSPLKAVLCVDGAAPDRLLEMAMPRVAEPVVWVPTHIVDVRGHRDLGLLRGGITGAGPLSRAQQQAIDAATAEHTHAILGHTARFVLDHAPCPVLLIRPVM